ncbi:MAG TPA: sensor histidine kinase, partial [Micromonospora sp.]
TEGAFGVLGLAVENAHLYAVQQAQIEQLRESRRRLSTAAFAERHRIQRDLHDGAQQQLYAVLMLLGAVRDAPGPPADPAPGPTRPAVAPPPGPARSVAPPVRVTVDRAYHLLREAIVGLQQLTQGIYPAALVDHGLAPAVQQLAEVAPVPLDVSIPADRWPRPVEVTAYFLIAEAVANAYKHSGAGRVHVRAAAEGGRLRVEVVDDGRGGARERPGSGLTGLRDRAAAVGGSIDVQSPPGGGTRITVTLPLTEPEDPCESVSSKTSHCSGTPSPRCSPAGA